MADIDGYDSDNKPQGLGTVQSGPDFTAPDKTYNADPQVAAAETEGEPEAQQDPATETEQSAATSKAAGYVKGGLETLANRTPVGRFIVGGKAKAYIAGILVFFVGIIALALFTFNLPTASIQAAGNGLSDTYFGAAIVTNTLHLDVYASKVISKIKTVGLTEMCATDGCVVESKLKGTKLGKFSFTMKQRVIAANEKIGTSALTDGSGNFVGLRIDTKNEKSSFYKEGGSTADQLTTSLAEAGVTEIAVEEVQKGVYNVVDNGITKSGKSTLFSTVMKESGFLPDVLSKTSGVRSLGRSLGLGFHPLQALRKVSNWEKGKTQIIADWLDNRNKSLTKGNTSTDITISGTQKDANGNELSVDEKTTKGGYRATLDKVQGVVESKVGSAGMTTAGAALMLQGAVCMVKAYYTAKDGVVTSTNIPTAMRSAQSYMSAAEQTQAVSSPDIDSEAIDAYVSNVLEKKHSDGSIDSFSQSREFGNLNGTGAGQAPSSDVSLMLGDTSDITPAMKPIYDLAMGSVGDTFCTGVGGLLTAGAGIVLGVVSDGIITTAGAAIVGAAVGFGVENMGNLMAKSLDPANYGPAQNYNVAGKGAGYLAAASSWSNGGSFQSSTSQAELQQVYAQSQQQTFSSKSLAYRLFNTYDTKSLASQIAVNNSSSLSANLQKMGQKLTGGSLIASSFAKIAGGSAYAKSNYNPCTQTLGGCVNLSNAVVNDDGTRAAGVLNGPNGQKYIDLMKQCHNIVFEKDDSGDWTTSVSGVDSYMAAAVSKKAPPGCTNIESDPSVVALLSYTNLESALALDVCMTAPLNSTASVDHAACTRVGYGSSSSTSTSTSTPSNDTTYRLPIPDSVAKNLTETNCWKPGHAGIDFPVLTGTDVLAAIGGTVVQETTSDGVAGAGTTVPTGNGLLIKGVDGKFASYQHLSQKLVHTGSTVTKGQVIGKSGATGYVFGNPPDHLHFTVANNQTWGSKNNYTLTIDPLTVLPKTGTNFACR